MGTLRGLLGVGAFVVSVTGCGGSASTSSNPGTSGAGTSSTGGSDASMQCTQFGESVCEDNANCSVETGQITSANRDLFVTTCVSTYNQALDCSKITSA